MTGQINEPDWQIFRRLQPIALERFCARVLVEIGRIAADDTKNSHERYLAIYKLIHERDEQLADAFNGMRRSRAEWQLGLIQAHGLLTEDEMARFSPETRARVKLLLGDLSIMSVEFTNNDADYLDWLNTHPNGFVINTPSGFSPSYMVLHRASCGSISNYTKMARPGGFTERDYVKICADTVDELRRWVRAHGRPDGSFTSECVLCKPE